MAALVVVDSTDVAVYSRWRVELRRICWELFEEVRALWVVFETHAIVDRWSRYIW